MQRSTLSYCLSLLFFLTMCTTSAQDSRPNIILIMGDDMGYSDIGCYGGVIETPVLDALAREGLRFTQFYNTGRCCPTRASLLTGLYPHQAGIGHMMNDKGTEGYRGDLSQHAVTIAEALKLAGYSTYISGKWHVTPLRPTVVNPSKHNWPLQRGFDKFFGTINGAGSFYDPNTLAVDNEYIAPSEDFYYTDAISDHAVDFIESHEEDNPFFLYLSYTAAHWPMHAKQEDIEKYKGKFDAGWDELRKDKYKKMSEMGLINSDWKLSEKDDIPDWENVELQVWYSELMETYAAMVDCMDQGIGRVLNSLEKRGMTEKTLVFFLQDNGGCAEEFGFADELKPHHSDVDPDKIIAMKPGAFQVDMVPRHTRDGRPVMVGKGLKAGGADTYLGYGKPWANASNTPFRMYKHWVHEGGISTPLIVYWPQGISSENEFRDEPSHLIDIMATCIDVAGARYPENAKGNKITPLEGKSLVPTFSDHALPERALFWEHEGNKAVRIGKYKLVSRWTKDAEYNWELYDLEKDRTELNNLINVMPEKAHSMENIWKDWARKSLVMTWADHQPIN